MEWLRLDKVLVDKAFFESREKAQFAIQSGNILVNGKQIKKKNHLLSPSDVISIASLSLPYVSLGGLKLEKAIRHFQLDFKKKKVLDVGASTGGFTDCALQHGASFVWAVDVGVQQFHSSLRGKPEIMLMEGTDIRTLQLDLASPIQADWVLADVSFISLQKIIPSLIPLSLPHTQFVFLVKPQFELEEKMRWKNGIIRDASLRMKVLQQILQQFPTWGLKSLGFVETDVKQDEKNVEFLVHACRV